MSAKKNKRRLQANKKRAKSVDLMHRCDTPNNASSSVHPGTSTPNAQIGVRKDERKQATRSSPFFPCFSRNESDQSESESDNVVCQQAFNTTTTNTVLRSSSANSFLSPLETDFIGSDSDFNFDDDSPSELTFQRLNHEGMTSAVDYATNIQSTSSNQPRNHQHSSFFQVAKEISTKLASTVVAAVATATRSNTSSPAPVINKSLVDTQVHPRTASTGTALQMSAVETTDGRVFATDMNQKYAIHTIVEYTNALVPDMVSISNAPYYWGRMDRYEAEQLLEGRPEGTFLLRDSAQINYLFSISFRRYKRTLHARIEHLNGMFSFDITDKSVFSASKITDVVANYKDPSKCLFFEPLLSIPMCRGFTFSLQHLCRSTIASHCDYASVADLPLPSQLKKFVREYHYKQPVRVTDQE